MTIDGIKKTDYTYQNTSNSTQAQSTKGTTSPNSVYNVDAANNTVVEESSVNSAQETKVDKLLKMLCEKLKKYGITVEDLKNSNLLEQITNLTAEQLEKVPEEKLEYIIQAMEAAIKDSIKDGKVNYEKATALGKDYLIALSTGWTIEGFKKQNNNVKKSSLLERLIETGCLPKDATIENTSMGELKTAVKKFSHIIIGKIEENPTEKDVLIQLQTFGRLLINSPKEEKELFLEIIKSLYAENRIKAMDAVMISCETNEQKNAVAKAASDSDYIKEITTSPIKDSEGKIVNDEVMGQEDATAFTKTIYENLSEEDIPECHEKFNKSREEWFKNNQEILESIDKKIKQAEENGTEPEFTEEEKQILLEKKNFIIGASSGEFLGTIVNNNLSEEFKNNHLKLLNEDSYKLSVYREIIEQINDFAEKRPESLSISKEELTKILDNATNGNYSIVVSNCDEPLNPPAQLKLEESIPDYGFTQRESINTSKLTELQQKINNSIDKQQDFRVEKTVTQPTSGNSLNEKFANAKTKQEKLDIIKNFFDNSPLLKKALEKYLTGMTDALNILNTLPTNARKYLAQKLTQNGQLDESDIQKLNLSFNDKQLLYNIINKENKAVTVV